MNGIAIICHKTSLLGIIPYFTITKSERKNFFKIEFFIVKNHDILRSSNYALDCRINYKFSISYKNLYEYVDCGK